MLSKIIIYVIGIFCVWGMCSVSCELRDYKGGHRFVGAFYANSPFQKAFTKLQAPNNVKIRDIGKITYIGYFLSILSAASLAVVLPLSIIMQIRGLAWGFQIFRYWIYICMALTLIAILFQGIDTLINRFLH